MDDHYENIQQRWKENRKFTCLGTNQYRGQWEQTSATCRKPHFSSEGKPRSSVLTVTLGLVQRRFLTDRLGCRGTIIDGTDFSHYWCRKCFKVPKTVEIPFLKWKSANRFFPIDVDGKPIKVTAKLKEKICTKIWLPW